MPPRKKTPILAAEISKNSIEQVSLSLQDLPEKPKDTYSLREAIALMHSSITTALARGYKHEEISKLLGNQGIKITASSLRRYLSITKPKGEGKTRAKRQTRKPRATSAEAAPEAAPKKPGRKPRATTAAAAVAKPAAKRGPKPAAATAAKTTTRKTTGTRRGRKSI